MTESGDISSPERRKVQKQYSAVKNEMVKVITWTQPVEYCVACFLVLISQNFAVFADVQPDMKIVSPFSL